jgi:hypothetical protein
MKYIVNIIAICLLAAGIFAAVKFRDSDTFYFLQKKAERVKKSAGEFMQAKKQVMEMEMSPTRKRPITFIEKEEKLRMFVPNVFEGFSEKAWEGFWDYIYLPIDDTSGKYLTKRHRTKEEIQSFLANKYSDPFSRFRSDHWHYFWEIVLGND